MTLGFTDSRQGVLDALYQMGAACCSYSSGNTWSDRCDCKYGLTDRWPAMTSEQTGCPELRSLHGVIGALTDEEWALLVHRAGGTPRGFVFVDDIGSRLHKAEAAAAMAEHHIGEVRTALRAGSPDSGLKASA